MSVEGGGDDARIRELLERRAARVRERPDEIQDQRLVWVAEFTMAGERCAIALDVLRAVAPVENVHPVPLAPPDVIGVLRYEGAIVSAHSLASLIGVRGWLRDPTTLLVLQLPSGELCAVDCEVIPKPTTLPAEAIEQARAREKGAVIEVLLTGEGEDSEIKLIDVVRLLESKGDRRHAG